MTTARTRCAQRLAFRKCSTLFCGVGAPGTQVLELASGYSLRGLDLTRSSTIRYVETDLPDVVATKLALLDDVRRQHEIASNPLHVVTVADA